MDAFTHYIRPGSTSEGSIYIRIHWDGMRLSITGCEGRHHYGQIRDVLYAPMTLADGWSPEQCRTLALLWDRWHLNDMCAGTVEQGDYLRQFPKDEWRKTHMGNWYGWACERLQEAGLLIHNGYRFGSSWLREDVPEWVLSFLHDLPRVAADAVPEWAR